MAVKFSAAYQTTVELVKAVISHEKFALTSHVDPAQRAKNDAKYLLTLFTELQQGLQALDNQPPE